MSEITQKQIFREIKNFLIIAIAISIGCFGWCAFVLTHKVPIGGIAGLSSVLYWGTGIPIQVTYFILNISLLLRVAIMLRILFGELLLVAPQARPIRCFDVAKVRNDFEKTKHSRVFNILLTQL